MGLQVRKSYDITNRNRPELRGSYRQECLCYLNSEQLLPILKTRAEAMGV